jgi:ParB family chromosome partitioning protein
MNRNRGLSALIPTGGSTPPTGQGFAQVSVDLIDPNPHQPRTRFDEESLEELAASIGALGVLQPVLLRKAADGRFQLIAGERRLRAAKKAGLSAIPAIIRDADDVNSAEQALVENLHRADLSPLEEAAAYKQLLEDFALTHDQVASRVGKSRTSITNALRLLTLPVAVQQLVADGRLTAGHAKALLGMATRQDQERLAARVVAEGLSVRATEQAVFDSHGVTTRTATSSSSSRTSSPGSATVVPTAAYAEVAALLGEQLATRVQVHPPRGTTRRGQLVIDFADIDDLERLSRVILD